MWDVQQIKLYQSVPVKYTVCTYLTARHEISVCKGISDMNRGTNQRFGAAY